MESPSENEWRALWKKSQGSIYQSWEWIKTLEALSETPKFILYHESNRLKAGIVGFERTLITPLGRKKIIQIKGDPVYVDEHSAKQVLMNLKEFSKDYFYTIISPYSDNILSILEVLGFSKSYNSTIILDLTKDESTLWSNLEKKSIRWGIKTAEKNGLVFSKTSDIKDIDLFYDSYIETTKQGGFHAESKELIISLVKSNLASLFTVKKDSMLLAAGLVLNDHQHQTMILDMTTASDEGLKQQAMPFLYWHMALFAKSSKYKIFDLGGYDLDAREGEKTHNINKFKERFGGQVKELPVYSSNRKYSTVRSLMKKFRFIKRLYKKN